MVVKETNVIQQNLISVLCLIKQLIHIYSMHNICFFTKTAQ